MRLRADHLGRQIQLHGDVARRASTTTKPTNASTSCSNRSRRNGVKHLVKRRLRQKRHQDQAQPRDALCRTGARMHGRHRDFRHQRKTIERIKEAFHRRHEELYTYSERHSTVEVVNIEFDDLRPDRQAEVRRARPRQDACWTPSRSTARRSSALPARASRTPVYDGGLLGAGAVD